ncbi:hypothetical protein BFW01_g6864 [Lasiodiplodia theobromae]|uniref:Putative transcription factor SEF1 n=2 Tax=Lasiodiplodia theobromae TaxID=45133 RepID=A0A5N5DT74_9PEZI|nr:putative transcription factor SEF1 [Lasiodiplodia theobromae]KAF9635969.1 hypothetical protein BFW01_g6864 [Lasiodiplodia theobromae]
MAAQTSPSTNGGPYSAYAASPPTPRHQLKRSQSSAGFESSPASQHDDDDQAPSKKAAQKRACNECRQQKLKCDVVQDPFTPCSRCRKQNLTCQVSANFKRIGKRSRHAEMEREAIDLKTRVKELEQREFELKQQLSSLGVAPSANVAVPGPHGLAHDNGQSTMFQNFLSNGQQQSQYSGGTHDDAVSSLVSLKQGFGGAGAFDRNHAYNLGAVYLTTEQAEELFRDYFAHYHRFLPLLDPNQSVESYMNQSKLLFWTVIVIAARHWPKDPTLLQKLTPSYRALLWTTISDVPQTYHVVKGMCLLCTWPLPASSTTMDETFMLAGVMMQIAMHHGLHQPSHAQDFSRTHVQLRDDEIKDRLSTWAVCNTVAHCVSVACGQPSTTLFDSALSFEHDHMDRLPEPLVNHVMLERSAARITKALYSDSGSRTFYDDKSILINYETTNLNDLEARLRQLNFTDLDLLYLRAVRLNLQLYAFFNKQEHGWHQDLLHLLLAANQFLESIFYVEEQAQLVYATNYISQMMVAAGFTLHRLLNSNFANTIPPQQLTTSRANFTRLITCIRKTSVRNNDLPQRLAEVLAQLWKAGGSGSPKLSDVENYRLQQGPTVDVSIHLKVRCRMSMSVVFDSIWHWREHFRGKGQMGNLDTAVNNPTDPETSNSTTPAPSQRLGQSGQAHDTASTSTSVSLDPNLPTLSLPTMNNSLSMGNAPEFGPVGSSTFADYTTDFFDPMSSILNDPVFFSNTAFTF